MPKTSKETAKSQKRQRHKELLGRFKPIDDHLLISGVLQTNDLKTVHLGTRFSCRFTLKDIQTRWNSLMYDKEISGLAIDAMRNLHAELIEKVERDVLFSNEEWELLTNITEMYPYVDDFEPLLQENKHVFHPARTAKDLFDHFHLLKKYNLLPGQKVEPLTALNDEIMSFSDTEQLLDDHDLEIKDPPSLVTELHLNNRRQIIEIRRLETEVDQLSGALHSMYGISEMDSKRTLAILRGQTVKFIMRSIKVTFGRNSKDMKVDIDLSYEGLADKISRRQGTLQLLNTGDFVMLNEGKRAIYVDGTPILKNQKSKLRHQALIEIGGLSFVFVINHELVDAFRRENLVNLMV